MKQLDIQRILDSIDVPEDPELIEKGDYLSLVRYFEKYRITKENKLIPPYMDAGRVRKAKELQYLADNCWDYAVAAVLFAIDAKYQGFSDGGNFFFKGDLGTFKAKEALRNIKRI